ncbi:MAG: gliding motility-associated C-terminal domain-containing protein [Candidatus Bipolaricaulota bacterium]|nr:gliding motility-associated C-terminal domain-containing protein [Candidatus Bipolaricaulota bacterium]MDW8031658.1 gliding motility-associated C-terminal domain-containing protein [Candidatus Bipolaricaulota bacterium]
MKNIRWLILGAIIALVPTLSVSAEWSDEDTSGKLLSKDSADTLIEARDPAIAAAGNTVYVVWSGDVSSLNEGRQIQLKRSFNGGITFEGDPIDVSGGTGSATEPAIAVNGSNVYIVWAEDDVPGHEGNPEICFAYSNNGGNSFRKSSKSFKNEAAVPEPCKKPLTEGTKVFNLNFNLSNTPKADSVCPSIAVNGSNIFVAWSELAKDGFQIMLAQSTNGGNSFARGKVVSKTLSGGKEADALCPKLAVSGTIVYGVWMEDSLGNFEIAFRQLTGKCTIRVGRQVRQGECPVINLSNSERDSVDPVIAVSGRNIYVAWADKSDGDFDIYFTASHDGGKTFSAPINVSDDDVDSLKPALAVDGTRVYLAWVDYDGNQGQIKFVRSTNSGEDFGDEQLLSDPRPNARQPVLAASGSKVFLAWADDIDPDVDGDDFEDFEGISAIFFRFSNESGLIAPDTLSSPAPSTLSAYSSQESGAVRFVAQGADVAAVKVEVFSLTGRLVYTSDFTTGNVLHWNGLSNAGQPLANGVYLYTLTVKDRNGNVMRAKVQKLVILR